ncbi:MAG: c-type cytochrome [Gemmatimonadota bacterium]|nr:c-type cytochrome [Gemmatimonadota bacterium]
MTNRFRLLTAVAALGAAACGGSEASTTNDAASAVTPVAAVNPATLDPVTITQAELALGDSVFHGLIGATSCQACHAAKGVGGPAAPSLADTTWLHNDGSYGAIYSQIESGVMAPKQFSSMMPPFGGTPLTPDRHRAVAAYVYSLSHPVTPR